MDSQHGAEQDEGETDADRLAGIESGQVRGFQDQGRGQGGNAERRQKFEISIAGRQRYLVPAQGQASGNATPDKILVIEQLAAGRGDPVGRLARTQSLHQLAVTCVAQQRPADGRGIEVGDIELGKDSLGLVQGNGVEVAALCSRK